MKATHVRAVAALATILTLSACGGKASFAVSGSIGGLNNAGLVLANSSNGDSVTVPAGATSFTFPKSVSYGDDYNVVQKTPPAHMTCSVISGGSGSAGHTTSIQVVVNCTQNAYTVGGLITGMTAGSLVLANGSSAATKTISKDETSFIMPDAVQDGRPYGITVLTQPDTLFCTVENGTDVMGEANRTNVVVNCKPK